MLCVNCMQFKNHENNCRCSKNKVYSCQYINLVTNCIFIDENNKRCCKPRQIHLFVCSKHINNDEKYITILDNFSN